VAEHEAAHDDRGDRAARDAAVGRRVADDEKAGRGAVTLRARCGGRRQRQDRSTRKKEENSAHFLLQSTPTAAAGTSDA
jgi:hypothetical protein